MKKSLDTMKHKLWNESLEINTACLNHFFVRGYGIGFWKPLR